MADALECFETIDSFESLCRKTLEIGYHEIWNYAMVIFINHDNTGEYDEDGTFWPVYNVPDRTKRLAHVVMNLCRFSHEDFEMFAEAR